MLAITKLNKKRICLDPRDLNKAIKREHYQMSTKEEISARLDKAKLFTTVAERWFFAEETTSSPPTKPQSTLPDDIIIAGISDT